MVMRLDAWLPSDGYTCGGKKEGLKACTAALAMDLLFNVVGPYLVKEDRISKLITIAYTWMFVPCLESNNKWLKQGIWDYFERKGAKVVLADCGAGSVRQHSILKYFKKYTMQSPLQMFKKRQKKD